MDNQIVMMGIGELKPYDKNPRKNKDAIEYVANSIKEFGFKQPIVVDENNVIIVGHTRLEAAKKLKLKEVPVLVASDLTEEQAKAYRLADNKTNEFAEWDDPLLGLELDDLDGIFDMEDFGFFEKEEKNKKEQIDGEVEFGEVLGEEHNYLVLYFDNEVDWLQLESILDIPKVKNYSTRVDGKITEGMKSTGVGRVMKGAEVLEKLREHYENIG